MVETGGSEVFAMSGPIAPVLASIIMWWVGTGLILILARRRSDRVRLELFGAGALLCISLYGVIVARDDASVTGAYVAFASAIGVWGWIEVFFLNGVVTGPRTAPCPPGAVGWTRFRMAAAAVLYHEVMIVGGLIVILLLNAGGPNPVAPLTFAALAALRLSAKLNLFLGVPNFSDDLMPSQLAYLSSYFRKRQASALMPISITAACAASLAFAGEALQPGPFTGRSTGYLLLSGLILLGALEHLFMVMPVRDSALWRWSRPAPATRDD